MLIHRKRASIWLFLLLVWFAVLITWALSISQVELDTSLQVRGPNQWVVGQPSVVRVVGLDLKFQRPIPIEDAKVRWKNNDKELPWQVLNDTTSLVWQNQISTPSESGEWTLETKVKLRGNDILATAKVEVSGETSPPDRPGFVSTTLALLDDTKPTSDVAVVTFDGDLKRSFDNYILMEVNTEASPTVSYKDLFGKTHILYVDATPIAGQFSLSVKPELPSLRLDISINDKTWVWHEDARPAFFDIREVTPRGRSLELTVESRDKDRNFFVDAWYGGQWLATTIAPGGQLLNKVTLEGFDQRDFNGPIWVQAYRNPFNPGGQRGGRYVIPQSQAEALASAWAKEKTSTSWKRIPGRFQGAHFLSGRLNAPQAIPNLLTDSAQLARPEVLQAQQYWLRLAGWLLGISTLALLLTLFLSVMRHRQRLEARLLEVVNEADAEEELEDTDIQRSWIDVVMTLGVMGLFLGGITWLFLTAKWG